MLPMIRIPLSVAVVLFAVVSCAKPLRATGSERYAVKRNASVAFINPAENGGSMLDSSAGLGEPLNVGSSSQGSYVYLIHTFDAQGHSIGSVFPRGPHEGRIYRLGKVPPEGSISSGIPDQPHRSF